MLDAQTNWKPLCFAGKSRIDELVISNDLVRLFRDRSAVFGPEHLASSTQNPVSSNHYPESRIQQPITPMSYRNLEIWQLARSLVVDIHQMTLAKLPKFEMFEQGSQIRRAVKSVKATIVEGYGRRRYKQEFVRFLIYAQGSCDETTDHLETLFETRSLTDQPLFDDLHQRLDQLGRKLNAFIQSVERSHISEK
jgi:four helix bundle protein